jgi:hypothetical protein
MAGSESHHLANNGIVHGKTESLKYSHIAATSSSEALDDGSKYSQPGLTASS